MLADCSILELQERSVLGEVVAESVAVWWRKAYDTRQRFAPIFLFILDAMGTCMQWESTAWAVQPLPGPAVWMQARLGIIKLVDNQQMG